jgi:hypothetical protein
VIPAAANASAAPLGAAFFAPPQVGGHKVAANTNLQRGLEPLKIEKAKKKPCRRQGLGF